MLNVIKSISRASAAIALAAGISLVAISRSWAYDPDTDPRSNGCAPGFALGEAYRGHLLVKDRSHRTFIGDGWWAGYILLVATNGSLPYREVKGRYSELTGEFYEDSTDGHFRRLGQAEDVCWRWGYSDGNHTSP